MEPLVINLGNKVKAQIILTFQQMAEDTYIPPKTSEVSLRERALPLALKFISLLFPFKLLLLIALRGHC